MAHQGENWATLRQAGVGSGTMDQEEIFHIPLNTLLFLLQALPGASWSGVKVNPQKLLVKAVSSIVLTHKEEVSKLDLCVTQLPSHPPEPSPGLPCAQASFPLLLHMLLSCVLFLSVFPNKVLV